ncbi:hypothetical protein [Teredinibacter purpureus]|jgi:hypothetical protein|uniref:hypothetical protein n=1 Tax=Teredinibacter purpureus TaxID=2731756 RepID=UPI0005F7BA17|nr:hypothetical protein [Teredinibacter purpureus]
MLTNEMKTIIFAIGCIFTLQHADAVEQIDTQYQWNFMSAQAWPAGYNQNTGKPDTLIYACDEYPQGFLIELAMRYQKRMSTKPS